MVVYLWMLDDCTYIQEDTYDAIRLLNAHSCCILSLCIIYSNRGNRFCLSDKYRSAVAPHSAGIPVPVCGASCLTAAIQRLTCILTGMRGFNALPWSLVWIICFNRVRPYFITRDVIFINVLWCLKNPFYIRMNRFNLNYNKHNIMSYF